MLLLPKIDMLWLGLGDKWFAVDEAQTSPLPLNVITMYSESYLLYIGILHQNLANPF